TTPPLSSRTRLPDARSTLSAPGRGLALETAPAVVGSRTTVVASWVAAPWVTRTDTRIGKPFVQSSGCPAKPSAQSAASTSDGNRLVKDAVGFEPSSNPG